MQTDGSGYVSTVVVDKLTKKDRQNIDSLIKLVGCPRNFAHNTVAFPRDIDLLISRGFTFPYGRDAMLGEDADGRKWIVTQVQGAKLKNKFWPHTCWYRINERGLCEKMREWTMPMPEFDALFPPKRRITCN